MTRAVFAYAVKAQKLITTRRDVFILRDQCNGVLQKVCIIRINARAESLYFIRLRLSFFVPYKHRIKSARLLQRRRMGWKSGPVLYLHDGRYGPTDHKSEWEGVVEKEEAKLSYKKYRNLVVVTAVPSCIHTPKYPNVYIFGTNTPGKFFFCVSVPIGFAQ